MHAYVACSGRYLRHACTCKKLHAMQCISYTWFLTAVTAPFFLQSTVAGSAACCGFRVKDESSSESACPMKPLYSLANSPESFNAN